MTQDQTEQADAASPTRDRSDLDTRDWGRGLLCRLDRACMQEAFVRFSSSRVELPSRRWLQQAMDEGRAGAFRGVAEAVSGR